MAYGKDGCCGDPPKCAFTRAGGRCKAREEYEKQQENPALGMTIRELMIHRHGIDAVLKAEAEARARSAAREREDERTWEGQRTLER